MRSVVHASALFIALGALVTVGCSSASTDDDAAGSSEAAQTKAGTTRIVLDGSTDAAARRLAVAFDAAFSAAQFGAGAAGHIFIRADDVSCRDESYCTFTLRDDANRRASVSDKAGKAQQLLTALDLVGVAGAGAGHLNARVGAVRCKSTLECTVDGVVHTGFAASRLKSTLAAYGAVGGANNVACQMSAGYDSDDQVTEGSRSWECELDPLDATGRALAHVALDKDPAPVASQLFHALKNAGVIPSTKSYGGSHPSSTTTIKANAVDCTSADPAIGGTSKCTLIVPDCATAGCGTGFTCCGAVRPTCVPAGAQCGGI